MMFSVRNDEGDRALVLLMAVEVMDVTRVVGRGGSDCRLKVQEWYRLALIQWRQKIVKMWSVVRILATAGPWPESY